jgi:hypothetical protein
LLSVGAYAPARLDSTSGQATALEKELELFRLFGEDDEEGSLLNEIGIPRRSLPAALPPARMCGMQLE